MTGRRPHRAVDVPHDEFSTDDEFITLINGEPPADADEERVRCWVIDGGYATDVCPYCGHALRCDTYERGSFDGGGGRHSELAECQHCAYWQCVLKQYSDVPGLPANVGWSAWISKLRQFEDLPASCLAELAQALRRNPRAWHSMAPEHLEQLVADIFRANFAQAEVVHVGRPADGGVDVLFVDAGVKSLIQVKRRRDASSSEGVVTVRNLLGAMVVDDALRGVVVSTADHFTYRAYETAGLAAKRGRTIELLDRGKLDRMLEPLLPVHAWRSVLAKSAPGLERYFFDRVRCPSKLPRAHRNIQSKAKQRRIVFDDDM